MIDAGTVNSAVVDVPASSYVILAALCGTAFLVGSFPTGYLVGRAMGVDVRTQGSGNTGATNVGRVLGKKLGILVLFVDVFKGIAAVKLARVSVAPLLIFERMEDVGSLLGLLALLGHCFSPFLRGRGGKGVATGVGAYLAIAPFQGMLALSIFVAVLRMTGYVSLSSIIAASAVPVLMAYDRVPFSHWALGCAACSAAVIVVRHAANIRRLAAGTESKFKQDKIQSA